MAGRTGNVQNEIINREHDEDLEAKRSAIWGVDPNDSSENRMAVDSSGKMLASTEETTYATRLDDSTTANTVYIGKATIGSATSSAVWQIKKVDTTTGADTTWADGNDNFDNNWDNRASLTYS